MPKKKSSKCLLPVSLVEGSVQMGLARFVGIRMHVVRIRREHRWHFHCIAAAAVLCASLLSHRHLNCDEFDVVHHRFQQL